MTLGPKTPLNGVIAPHVVQQTGFGPKQIIWIGHLQPLFLSLRFTELHQGGFGGIFAWIYAWIIEALGNSTDCIGKETIAEAQRFLAALVRITQKTSRSASQTNNFNSAVISWPVLCRWRRVCGTQDLTPIPDISDVRTVVMFNKY